MNRAILPALALSLLAGCAGSPKYACGVPEGVGCRPVGEIYEASVAGVLPGKRNAPSHEATEDGRRAADTSVIATIQPGDPLLTRPRHIRVWIDRWEDQAGDLHDETYLYLRLDNGAWRIGQ